MRKRIYLTEAQYKILLEAANESFKLEDLDSLKSLDDLLSYCLEHIGSVCDDGSSRTVFVLDDDTVLKIAKNEKGIAQNEAEINLYESTKSPLLAEIKRYGANKTWIVSERAYTCVETDFERIIGIPWRNFWEHPTEKSPRKPRKGFKDGGDWQVGFDKYFADKNHRVNEPYNGIINVRSALMYIDSSCNSDEEDEYASYSVEKAIKTFPWLREMQRFVKQTHVRDIAAIDNYGIVHRNGKDMIVMIDSGLTTEIYKKYYSTWQA